MSKCNHTLHPINGQGQATGSWVLDHKANATRIVCKSCQKFYGIVEFQKSAREEEQLRKAYLEQQRRLSCPGCGEEPFLS